MIHLSVGNYFKCAVIVGLLGALTACEVETDNDPLQQLTKLEASKMAKCEELATQSWPVSEKIQARSYQRDSMGSLNVSYSNEKTFVGAQHGGMCALTNGVIEMVFSNGTILHDLKY